MRNHIAKVLADTLVSFNEVKDSNLTDILNMQKQVSSIQNKLEDQNCRIRQLEDTTEDFKLK